MNWSPCAYVYGLRFEGEEIFYIGSARNMRSRMRAHSSYKEDARYPYQRHILKGVSQGKVLEMVELERTNVNEALEREAFWIWKHPGKLFNRVLPTWAVLTESEGEEIKLLNETIIASKERMNEIHRQARARARAVNAELRASKGLEQKSDGKTPRKTRQ